MMRLDYRGCFHTWLIVVMILVLSGCANLSGKYYFSGNHESLGSELWVTEKSGRNTRLLKEICTPSCSSYPSEIAVSETKIFFSAYDREHGRELWVSDGTANGTVMLKDIMPGPKGSDIREIFIFDGLAFFMANDGVNGFEPWVSKGTKSSTRMLKDIATGSGNSLPAGFSAVKGRVYFSATDDSHGRELWSSDGTEAGTMLVKDIRRGPEHSNPHNIIAVGNDVMFTTANGDDFRLYRSDGTPQGTLRINGSFPEGRPLSPELFVKYKDGAYFISGNAIWKTNATAEGTMPVTRFDGPGSPLIKELVMMKGELFFNAYHSHYGMELWVLREPASELEMVKDILPGTGSSAPRKLTVVGQTLFFFADDGINGVELWSTNGRREGTAMIIDLDGKGSRVEKNRNTPKSLPRVKRRGLKQSRGRAPVDKPVYCEQCR